MHDSKRDTSEQIKLSKIKLISDVTSNETKACTNRFLVD